MGLELDDLLAHDTDIDTWWFDGRRISEREIVAAFVPVAAAIVRDVASLGDGALDYTDANPAFRALDAMNIAQWLDREHVSGWLRKLIAVAYTTEMGLEIDRQSALNLLTFIGTDDPDVFRVFGASDERFHVRGGNDRIPHAVADRLDDAIEPGAVLEAIRARGDDLVLTFRRNGATQDVHAAQAILALPFTLLRKVAIDVPMPAHKRNAIDRLPYGTNAKLMIGYDRRVWRAQGANGASMSDLSYQTTWDTTREQPGAQGVLTNFTGGAHGVALGQGTPRMQADAATADLDRVFPGLAAARTQPREARFHWPSHPWTLGSYACFGPGDWSALRGAVGESVGRLFLPVSTAHWRRKASWRAVASRASSPRRPCNGHAECVLARGFIAFTNDDSAPLNEPFCTARYRFAVQRANPITIPSRSPRIPTWGREQARNRFVRGGLFICRCHHGRDDGPHRHPRRTPARSPARDRLRRLDPCARGAPGRIGPGERLRDRHARAPAGAARLVRAR